VDPHLRGIPLDRFEKVLSIAPVLVELRVKPCKVLSATLEPRSDKLSVGGKYTTGTAETKVDGPSVMFEVRLECLVDSPRSPSQPAIRRTGETASHSFGIDCRNRESHYFAQGFDYYSDKTTNHWDSQGSARAKPWRAVRTENAMVRRVFDAVCFGKDSKS
jgi:hypothetical protein